MDGSFVIRIHDIHFILIRLYLFTRLTEECVMNDIEEIIQAIYIGVVIATFLYMTGRARKAIELCKESLVLLNNKALEKEKQFAKFLHEAIYKVLFVWRYIPAKILTSSCKFSVSTILFHSSI